MTLRDAMMTLRGEADAHGDPQPVHMRRMLERLASLRASRAAAAAGRARFGPAILKSYDRDIVAQLHAITRAVRLNPALAPMASEAGVETLMF